MNAALNTLMNTAPLDGVPMSFEQWLPVLFLGLMGLAMLVYVILDGFDLGVGMLMPLARRSQRDTMVASIGPFWDANETWLVLGVGLLLIAFPKAQGRVLGALYLPVVFMLVGLILRGVAFDFRVKAQAAHQALWNRLFSIGSGLASVMQGWMLGRYVTGLREDTPHLLFAGLIALALPATYVLLGACWLILKTEGELQLRAIDWAKRAWPLVVAGIVGVSLMTPWVSPGVRARWFAMPAFIALLPIPLVTGLALLALRGLLNSHRIRGKLCGAPFALLVLVLLLSFLGLAYSLYPFVIVDQMTVWQAASSPAALKVIGIGVLVTLPVIAVYSVMAYRVFGGKADQLRYA